MIVALVVLVSTAVGVVIFSFVSDSLGHRTKALRHEAPKPPAAPKRKIPDARIDRLEEELILLRRDLYRRGEQIATAEIETKDTERLNLTRGNALLKKENAALKGGKNRSEEQIATLNDSVKDLTAKIDSKERVVTELKESQKALKEGVEKTQAECEAAKKDLNQTEKEKATISEELGRWKESHSRQEKELSQAKEDNADLKDELGYSNKI